MAQIWDTIFCMHQGFHDTQRLIKQVRKKTGMPLAKLRGRHFSVATKAIPTITKHLTGLGYVT